MRDGLVEDVEEEASKGPEEGLNLSWRTTRKSWLKLSVFIMRIVWHLHDTRVVK